MFIEPRRATALAAVTSVKPCSTAWGMRCVPTRPLDVYPHTKKLPARSQKSRVRVASRSDVVRRSSVRSAAVTIVASPNGTARTCSGRSRMKMATGASMTAHPTSTAAIAQEHHKAGPKATVGGPPGRPAESEGQDAERYAERDLRPRPSEFRLERRDDHARSGAHRLRREEREERDDDNEPRVVEALH